MSLSSHMLSWRASTKRGDSSSFCRNMYVLWISPLHRISPQKCINTPAPDGQSLKGQNKRAARRLTSGATCEKVADLRIRILMDRTGRLDTEVTPKVWNHLEAQLGQRACCRLESFVRVLSLSNTPISNSRNCGQNIR